MIKKDKPIIWHQIFWGTFISKITLCMYEHYKIICLKNDPRKT